MDCRECVCVCVSVEQRKTLPVCYFPAQMFIKYICFNAAERCLHWEKVKDSAKHVWGVQKVAKVHLHTEKAQHKSVWGMCVQNKITLHIKLLCKCLTAMHHRWAYAFIWVRSFPCASQHMLFCCWARSPALSPSSRHCYLVSD